MSTKTWWSWSGTREYAHGRATYFGGTDNEVTVSMPNFEQAHLLANAIEAQVETIKYNARNELLQEIGRIKP